MALSKSSNSDLSLEVQLTKIKCEYLANIRQNLLEKMEKMVRDCSSRIEEKFILLESRNMQRNLGQPTTRLTSLQHEMLRIFRHVSKRRERGQLASLTSIIQLAVTGQVLNMAQLDKVYSDVRITARSMSNTPVDALDEGSVSTATVGERQYVINEMVYELHRLEGGLIALIDDVYQRGLFGINPNYEVILQHLQGTPYHTMTGYSSPNRTGSDIISEQDTCNEEQEDVSPNIIKMWN